MIQVRDDSDDGSDFETAPPAEYKGNVFDQALTAAEFNDTEHLKKLIAQEPAVVCARDSDRYTPLHRASYSGHLESVKLLLDNGADHKACTLEGWQPLHCAARWGNYEIAHALIAAGADINATSNGGMTPLHLAANEKNGRKTVELLLWQSSIDAQKANRAGDLPKFLARRKGNFSELFEMVEPSVSSLHLEVVKRCDNRE